MGSPSCFFPPNSSIEHNKRPTSLWKGREDGGGGILASEGADILFVEPTSLNGGEGLVAVCQRMVGGELVWGRRVGGGGMREEARTSTVMRLMSILNSAPPQR